MIVRAGVGDESSRRELNAVAELVAKGRKTIVVTGAGISCNAGIPDFRSEDGLYNLVKTKYPKAVVTGKDLFDAILFSDPTSTQIFYTFMAELRQCIMKASTTPTHKFIKKLSDSGKLIRCYTQNIDGLESREGLELCVRDQRKNQVLQLHGDIHELKCIMCNAISAYKNEYIETLRAGSPPPCPSCLEKFQVREVAGLRTGRIGTLRPNIVLYGEEHPTADIIQKAKAADLRRKPDLLIILGTSLKVAGIKSLVKEMAKSVHAKGGKVIYVNKTELARSQWNGVVDYWVDGCCDEWVHSVKEAKPSIWTAEQTKLPKMLVMKAISNKENKDPKQPQSPSKRKLSPVKTEKSPKKAACDKFTVCSEPPPMMEQTVKVENN